MSLTYKSIKTNNKSIETNNKYIKTNKTKSSKHIIANSVIAGPMLAGLFVTIGAPLILVLCACKLAPTEFCSDELYQTAKQELCQMFAGQEPVRGEMDFAEALSRGLKYNLDNTVKQSDVAIKAGAVEVAKFAMLPVLGLSSSVYNRSNTNATFSSFPNGTVNKGVLAFGADKTLRTARLGLKWNLVDLGMGYIKTKEEGEKLLIAEEEARQQLQKLVQDLRVGYWSAYTAQELLQELQELYPAIYKAKEEVERALNDKYIPKEDLLRYQGTLLDANRRLVEQEDKLKKALLLFRYLINLPYDEPLCLKKPPASLWQIQDLKNLDFEKLDAITLVNRPELRSQGYQRRIAELGLKTAIFQALPVVTLNQGRNYDSNSFLLNNYWSDRSIELSWNIFNLAALPVSLRNVDIQTTYESLKLMALTLGALNETRINYAHYRSLAKESLVAKNQSENTKRLFTLTQNKSEATLASRQQVILSKMNMLFARIDEMLLLSDLSTALGQLYIAVGFDVVPVDAIYASPQDVICMIEENLSMQEQLGFKGYVNVTYNKLFNTCQKGCE